MRLLLFVALLVTGCGGGGSSTTPTTPPPVQQRTDPVLFGYFGIDGAQTAETADHATVTFTPDWGNWDDPADRERIAQATISHLQEASARGIRKAIVSVGFLVFDSQFHYRGTADLDNFRKRLDQLGLTPMVAALYPVDEPELHSSLNTGLEAIYGEIRQTWPVPIAVIYGDHGRYPGVSAADWVGFDDYDHATVTGPISLRNDQRRILVPGGADPWRVDPMPYVAEAKVDAQVVAVIAFCWFDFYSGTAHRGIRSNGMAPQYRAAFRS